MRDFVQRTLNPCFGLAALFMFSVGFLRVVKDTLLSYYPTAEGVYSFMLMPYLQASSALVMLVAIAGYLFYCRNAEIKKALFAPLKWLTLLVALLGVMLYFTKSLALPEGLVSTIFPGGSAIYTTLATHWNITLLFYALSLLSPTLISAVLWASANISSRDDDRKANYLLLALALGFGASIGYMVHSPVLLFISRTFSQATYIALALGVFGLSLGHRILKTWLKRFALAERSSRTENEPISKKTLSSLFSSSAIIGLLAAGSTFFMMYEKSIARSLFSSPAEYSALMGKFAFVIGSASLALQVAATALGTRALKAGFFKRFLAGSMGLTFLLMGVFIAASLLAPGTFSIFSFALLKAALGVLGYFVFVPLAQAKIAERPLGQQILLQMLMMLLMIPVISSTLPRLMMQFALVSLGNLSAALPLFVALGALSILVASLLIYTRYMRSKPESRITTS